MLTPRSLLSVLVVFSLSSAAMAELPLPDATLYGQLRTPAGAAVSSGALTARVERGGAAVITVSGVFVAAEGQSWYVVRVPLETNIGAPGPSGVAAREGDRIATLLVDGKTVALDVQPTALRAGQATRIDGTVDQTPQGIVFFRGDCSPDLNLSITDAVKVLNYLFIGGSEPTCLAACDSDASGLLNITDGVYVLAFLFLGGPPPPAPGARCGVDPDPSDLGCAQTNCAV